MPIYDINDKNLTLIDSIKLDFNPFDWVWQKMIVL